MKRFDYEDGEEFQEENFPDLGELTENDYEQLIEHAEYVDIRNLGLSQFELNQKLLYKAMKICENTFLWRFKDVQKKLKLIGETYATLKVFMNIEEEN